MAKYVLSGTGLRLFRYLGTVGVNLHYHLLLIPLARVIHRDGLLYWHATLKMYAWSRAAVQYNSVKKQKY